MLEQVQSAPMHGTELDNFNDNGDRTHSLYVEHGSETFHSVHVESAQRIAAQAQRAGVKRLVHVSGIVPIPARNRSISESAAKANWRFGTPLPMPFSSARRSCLGRMMHFSPLSSSSSSGSRSIQCSAPARCDCSQSTWKMLRRRSQRCCNGRKLTRLRSSAVASRLLLRGIS
jgi:hypothetical protein